MIRKYEGLGVAVFVLFTESVGVLSGSFRYDRIVRSVKQNISDRKEI